MAATVLRCRHCQRAFPEILEAELHSISTEGCHVDFDAVDPTDCTSPPVPQEAGPTVPLDTRGSTPSSSPSELGQPTEPSVVARKEEPFDNKAEVKKATEERLKLRAAEKLERDRILDLIKKNKKQQAVARHGVGAKISCHGSSSANPIANPALSSVPLDSNEVKLRLRMFDTCGILDKVFSRKAKLSDVAAALQEEMDILGVQSFSWQGSFPPKVWEEAEFSSVTLEEAGLGKSAALIVKRKK
ncbi:hypothetical protein QBC47DRAFT_385137 [Echria macrotheca]|uniref:UBX domain-containing protein n=1 Tax=Echria macrotheca TaxID=438768 RepID=A0AAJ0F806_9PEZI|nr:hypothetical protein QBC47DRAFT_385137 [Echria macrotheca]